MVSGLPDFSKYVVLKSSEVTLDVDVVGSVTLDVNIVGSVVLDVNIKSQSVTLNVNIESQSVTLDVNIASSDVTLNVNVTNASITVNIGSPLDADGNLKTSIQSSVQIDVNIAASAVTLDVNIKSQAVTLDVNIKAQDVTLNVNVQGTASVSIDNATVYLNVKNDNMLTVTKGISSGEPSSYTYNLAYPRGFLIRNARGLIRRLSVYMQNTNTTTDKTVTVKIAILPYYPPIYTFTVTVPADSSGLIDIIRAYYGPQKTKPWNYDTMFVWFEADSEVRLGDGNIQGYVYFKDEWYTEGSFAAEISIACKTKGDIPVSGTVNTIQIPNSSSMVVSEHVTVNPGGSAVLINIEGTGEVSRVYLDCAGVNQAYVKLKITIDGRVVLDKYLSWIDLFEHSAPAPAAPVESYQWDNTSKTYVFAFNYTFKFRKQFKVEIFNEHDADTLSVLPFCYYDLIM
ncbi:MAG: hypothetical protein DRP09_12920 [Candidatus Thorarchaeota archaeon]|nr:MAG: hypothetical protein DRP09_12920 [Candidatus Thorarchaeota archaeon]